MELNLGRMRWDWQALAQIQLCPSERLPRAHEAAVCARWEARVLDWGPQGRLVKVVADHALMSWPDCEMALLDLQRLLAAPGLILRAGLHWAQVCDAGFELLGTGVNLAERLCSLGQERQLVLSASALEQIEPCRRTPLIDLGPCHLKHWPEALQAFAWSAPTSAPANS